MRAVKKELKNFKTLAKSYGQYRTIKSCDSVDSDGNPIPWYTYPTIEYLNNIDFSSKSIFEYGSGNSSLFWGKRAKLVISVEHNREWHEKLKNKISARNQLLLREDKEKYVKSILEQNRKFDIVIIDGENRVECSKVIDSSLNKESNEGYMIILDNADWFTNTSKYLREKLNLIEVDFHGFGPINSYTWTTSIFLSRNFSFKSVGDIQPVFSKAGLKHNCEAE